MARRAEALGSGPLRVTSSSAPPPCLPLPAAWRCAVAHRAGGWSHRWVPLFLGGWESLGLWPSAGHPLRHWREGDNCPETQHLSEPVVQGAREGRLRAAALTPQRPGMRAGARGGRGVSGGASGRSRWRQRAAPRGRAAAIVAGNGEGLGSQPGPATCHGV